MKTQKGILYWSPRIICIISILFISIFSLDAFEGEASIWMKLGAFLLHSIPSFILTAVLILAWNKERIGGIIFVILGLALATFVFYHNYTVNKFDFWNCVFIVLMIAIPFVIVGALFIANDRKRKLAS